MNPGFLNVVDAKENQNSIVEDDKTAHKEYLTEYGKFFYDMRDKLEMIGGYKIDVPFTYGTTTLSQSNRLSGIVGCDQKSVNIFCMKHHMVQDIDWLTLKSMTQTMYLFSCILILLIFHQSI